MGDELSSALQDELRNPTVKLKRRQRVAQADVPAASKWGYKQCLKWMELQKESKLEERFVVLGHETEDGTFFAKQRSDGSSLDAEWLHMMDLPESQECFDTADD